MWELKTNKMKKRDKKVVSNLQITAMKIWEEKVSFNSYKFQGISENLEYDWKSEKRAKTKGFSSSALLYA